MRFGAEAHGLASRLSTCSGSSPGWPLARGHGCGTSRVPPPMSRRSCAGRVAPASRAGAVYAPANGFTPGAHASTRHAGHRSGLSNTVSWFASSRPPLCVTIRIASTTAAFQAPRSISCTWGPAAASPDTTAQTHPSVSPPRCAPAARLWWSATSAGESPVIHKNSIFATCNASIGHVLLAPYRIVTRHAAAKRLQFSRHRRPARTRFPALEQPEPLRILYHVFSPAPIVANRRSDVQCCLACLSSALRRADPLMARRCNNYGPQGWFACAAQSLTPGIPLQVNT